MASWDDVLEADRILLEMARAVADGDRARQAEVLARAMDLAERAGIRREERGIDPPIPVASTG